MTGMGIRFLGTGQSAINAALVAIVMDMAGAWDIPPDRVFNSILVAAPVVIEPGVQSTKPELETPQGCPPAGFFFALSRRGRRFNNVDAGRPDSNAHDASGNDTNGVDGRSQHRNALCCRYRSPQTYNLAHSNIANCSLGLQGRIDL